MAAARREINTCVPADTAKETTCRRVFVWKSPGSDGPKGVHRIYLLPAGYSLKSGVDRFDPTVVVAGSTVCKEQAFIQVCLLLYRAQQVSSPAFVDSNWWRGGLQIGWWFQAGYSPKSVSDDKLVNGIHRFGSNCYSRNLLRTGNRLESRVDHLDTAGSTVCKNR